MTLERLKAARKKTIGTKQTAKAVDKGLARAVFVARDAEEYVVRELLKACRKQAIPVVEVESMAVLGRTCGIEVGAASAAIIEE